METLIENNKLIAEFMGLKEIYTPKLNIYEISKTETYLETDLAYHTDWNWLMPVVVKILDISLESDSMEPYYNITDSIPNIKETYKEVIEFINWYNTKLKS